MTPRIILSEVLNDLKNGYTRLIVSKGYDPEIGSIQGKYDLTRTQVTELFKHPQLLGKKTIFAKSLGFIIEDDITVTEDTNDSANISLEESEVENFETIDENATSVVEVQEEVQIEELERVGTSNDPFDFN